MKPRLEVFADCSWGEAVGDRLRRRIAAAPGLRLCLPTGKTPVPAYRSFAAGGGSLAGAEVFLLDEFVLPAEDPARCDHMLREDLLSLLVAPPAQLHTPNVVAESLEAECARYEEEVAAGGLDLTLLGLGGNGHVGLNEPGADATSLTRPVRLAESTIASAARYGASRLPTRGVTLGMGVLLASREIWLLVTGEHKATILAEALTGPIGPHLPASYLQEHDNCAVLADTSAAALLRIP